MTTKTLYLRILSPQNTLFEGSVLSISSRNILGDFDILPEHANFITLIDHQPIIVSTSKKEPLKFDLPLSIIHVFEDKVNIYTRFSE